MAAEAEAAGAGAGGGGASAGLGYAAIALMASNALGSYMTAQAQAKMQGNYYNFLADQSRLKANYLRQEGDAQAENAQDEGLALSKQLHKNVRQIESNQRSSMIAQGIELGSVTAEDITRDTLSKEKLDEMVIRYNADTKAYQAKRNSIIQAANAYAEAGSMGLSGQMISSATRLQGTSSLIGGAGQTASNSYLMFGKGGTSETPSTASNNNSYSISSYQNG